MGKRTVVADDQNVTHNSATTYRRRRTGDVAPFEVTDPHNRMTENQYNTLLDLWNRNQRRIAIFVKYTPITGCIVDIIDPALGGEVVDVLRIEPNGFTERI